MKFGVVVFPGSNCDRDMYDALKYDLGQEVTMLWHKDKDLSQFNTEDCIILPAKDETHIKSGSRYKLLRLCRQHLQIR